MKTGSRHRITKVAIKQGLSKEYLDKTVKAVKKIEQDQGVPVDIRRVAGAAASAGDNLYDDEPYGREDVMRLVEKYGWEPYMAVAQPRRRTGQMAARNYCGYL